MRWLVAVGRRDRRSTSRSPRSRPRRASSRCRRRSPAPSPCCTAPRASCCSWARRSSRWAMAAPSSGRAFRRRRGRGLPRRGEGRLGQRAHRVRNRRRPDTGGRKRRPRGVPAGVVASSASVATGPVRGAFAARAPARPGARRRPAHRDADRSRRDRHARRCAAGHDHGIRSDSRRSSAPATTGTRSGDVVRTEPLSMLRRAVAAKMSRSRTEIPEATVWVDVDVTELWAARAAMADPATSTPPPSLTAMLARFVAAALGKLPGAGDPVERRRHRRSSTSTASTSASRPTRIAACSCPSSGTPTACRSASSTKRSAARRGRSIRTHPPGDAHRLDLHAQQLRHVRGRRRRPRSSTTPRWRSSGSAG